MNDMTNIDKSQLQMLWPESRFADPPVVKIPNGYKLKAYQRGDEVGFFHLMERAGFGKWNIKKLDEMLVKVIPNGFFFIILKETEQLVCTAMALHSPSRLHPFGAELGWLAGDPEHKGKGLGMVVCSVVVRRLICGGYKRIYLKTDDYRLPALKIYLKIGFLPFLFKEGMQDRWKLVCEKLHWPYTPEVWPKEIYVD